MGWGQVGQHRKHSQKGGRKPGRHKHLWTYTVKYDPDYFGKKGFSSPQSLRQKINVINLRQLDELIGKLEMERKVEKKAGKFLLDLSKFGYNKLLATGRVTKPVLVRVALYSKKAAEKIEGAGGQILATTRPSEMVKKVEKTKETAIASPKV